MAIAKHFGFDLYPQSANLPDRKLLVPNGFEVEVNLDRLVDEGS